jgi:hypothetical protein
VAEKIRRSRPCIGAAVAGTGVREEGDDRWGRATSEREERARLGLREEMGRAG